MQVNEDELWFETDKVEELLADADCESYLLAMLLDAMAEGRDIVIHGFVSKELLSNLTEFRDIWVSWLPQRYSRIDLHADTIIQGQARKNGAICAFSGGLDATFSTWRNTRQRNGSRSQSINLCAMVHGFDIPIEDGNAFAKAFSRAKDTLTSLGIPIRPIRTNFRKISKISWEDVFAPALVAALANYKCLAGTCLVASSNPYNALIMPWGSTPITDHLLSAEDFFVIHDGASHTRTEKALAISEWPAGFENLRVCWEGEAKEKNCGKCEKCLRTMLNIAANGLPIPSCFPDAAISLADVKTVELRSFVQRGEWRQLLETAKQNGITADWVAVVDRKVNPHWSKVLIKKINLHSLKGLIFPDNTVRKWIAKKAYLHLKGRQ